MEARWEEQWSFTENNSCHGAPLARCKLRSSVQKPKCCWRFALGQATPAPFPCLMVDPNLELFPFKCSVLLKDIGI